jgi:SAM-dependent methyltransferase
MPAEPLGRAKTGTQVDWAPRSWFEAQVGSGGASGSADYFGHAANGYQRFRHAQLEDAVAQIASALARDALLDIGCATGVLTARLATRFGFRRAVGVDFLAAVLDEARRLFPSLELHEAQLPELPFEDGSFDLVVASEVLYYLTPEARSKAIGEVARVLRPGGYLLFTSALGSSYFTVESARTLIGGPLQIVAERRLHMGLYHAVSQPFYLTGRLRTILAAGTQPGSAEMQERLARWRWLVANPMARLAIGMIARVGRRLLASEGLPRLLNRLRLGQATNTILVARRAR